MNSAGRPQFTQEQRRFAERLGALLRNAREAAGLTYQRAADLLEIDLATLRRRERGRVPGLSLWDFLRACRAYRASPGEILQRIGREVV